MKTSLYLFTFLLAVFGANAQSNPDELIQATIAKARAVKSAAFMIENTERYDGELRTGSQEVRYQQQPFQLSMTFISPDPGSTITYDATVNADKMVYDPEGFPYMKMELDPMGSLARNNNQHTIYEIGFDHIGRLIELIYENRDQVSLLTTGTSAGVHRVQISSKRRGIGAYVVSKGESTRSVSQKLQVSEYKLVELNEGIKEYGPIKEGMTIKVPEYYALETIIDIDRVTYLPVKLHLSDELGLLSAYTFSEVSLDIEVMHSKLKKKNKPLSGHQ